MQSFENNRVKAQDRVTVVARATEIWVLKRERKKKYPRRDYTSSAKRHPPPRMKTTWISLHNAQVRLWPECPQPCQINQRQLTTAAPPPKKKSEQLRNLLLLPARQQHAILKTGINPCVLGSEKGERREGEQRAGSRGKLKLVSLLQVRV